MKQRLDYLDVAKGLGIILVLLGHSCGIPFAGAYVNSFYMAMFFVVAGYVYHPSEKSYGQSVARRFKRILIPYFAYNGLLFAYFVLRQIIGGIVGGHEAAGAGEYLQAIVGVLYSRNFLWVGRDENIYFFKLLNDPVWFLTAMCTAALIFYGIVDKCLKSRKNCVLISVILLGAAIVMSYLPILLPWSMDSAPLYAWYMLCGALLGRGEFFKKKYTVLQWAGLMSAWLFSVLLRYWNGTANMSVRMYGNHGAASVLAIAYIGLAGSIMFVFLSRLICHFRLAEQVLSYVGRNSLVIMALHMAVFSVVGMVLGKVMEVSVLYYVLYITITMCICLLVGGLEKRLP